MSRPQRAAGGAELAALLDHYAIDSPSPPRPTPPRTAPPVAESVHSSVRSVTSEYTGWPEEHATPSAGPKGEAPATDGDHNPPDASVIRTRTTPAASPARTAPQIDDARSPSASPALQAQEITDAFLTGIVQEMIDEHMSKSASDDAVRRGLEEVGLRTINEQLKSHFTVLQMKEMLEEYPGIKKANAQQGDKLRQLEVENKALAAEARKLKRDLQIAVDGEVVQPVDGRLSRFRKKAAASGDGEKPAGGPSKAALPSHLRGKLANELSDAQDMVREQKEQLHSLELEVLKLQPYKHKVDGTALQALDLEARNGVLECERDEAAARLAIYEIYVQHAKALAADATAARDAAALAHDAIAAENQTLKDAAEAAIARATTAEEELSTYVNDHRDEVALRKRTLELEDELAAAEARCQAMATEMSLAIDKNVLLTDRITAAEVRCKVVEAEMVVLQRRLEEATVEAAEKECVAQEVQAVIMLDEERYQELEDRVREAEAEREQLEQGLKLAQQRAVTGEVAVIQNKRLEAENEALTRRLIALASSLGVTSAEESLVSEINKLNETLKTTSAAASPGRGTYEEAMGRLAERQEMIRSVSPARAPVIVEVEREVDLMDVEAPPMVLPCPATRAVECQTDPPSPRALQREAVPKPLTLAALSSTLSTSDLTCAGTPQQLRGGGGGMISPSSTTAGRAGGAGKSGAKQRRRSSTLATRATTPPAGDEDDALRPKDDWFALHCRHEQLATNLEGIRSALSTGETEPLGSPLSSPSDWRQLIPLSTAKVNRISLDAEDSSDDNEVQEARARLKRKKSALKWEAQLSEDELKVCRAKLRKAVQDRQAELQAMRCEDDLLKGILQNIGDRSSAPAEPGVEEPPQPQAIGVTVEPPRQYFRRVRQIRVSTSMNDRGTIPVGPSYPAESLLVKGSTTDLTLKFELRGHNNELLGTAETVVVARPGATDETQVAVSGVDGEFHVALQNAVYKYGSQSTRMSGLLWAKVRERRVADDFANVLVRECLISSTAHVEVVYRSGLTLLFRLLGKSEARRERSFIQKIGDRHAIAHSCGFGLPSGSCDSMVGMTAAHYVDAVEPDEWVPTGETVATQTEDELVVSTTLRDTEAVLEGLHALVARQTQDQLGSGDAGEDSLVTDNLHEIMRVSEALARQSKEFGPASQPRQHRALHCLTHNHAQHQRRVLLRSYYAKLRAYQQRRRRGRTVAARLLTIHDPLRDTFMRWELHTLRRIAWDKANGVPFVELRVDAIDGAAECLVQTHEARTTAKPGDAVCVRLPDVIFGLLRSSDTARAGIDAPATDTSAVDVSIGQTSCDGRPFAVGLDEGVTVTMSASVVHKPDTEPQTVDLVSRSVCALKSAETILTNSVGDMSLVMADTSLIVPPAGPHGTGCWDDRHETIPVLPPASLPVQPTSQLEQPRSSVVPLTTQWSDLPPTLRRGVCHQLVAQHGITPATTWRELPPAVQTGVEPQTVSEAGIGGSTPWEAVPLYVKCEVEDVLVVEAGIQDQTEWGDLPDGVRGAVERAFPTDSLGELVVSEHVVTPASPYLLPPQAQHASFRSVTSTRVASPPTTRVVSPPDTPLRLGTASIGDVSIGQLATPILLLPRNLVPFDAANASGMLPAAPRPSTATVIDVSVQTEFCVEPDMMSGIILTSPISISPPPERASPVHSPRHAPVPEWQDTVRSTDDAGGDPLDRSILSIRPSLQSGSLSITFEADPSFELDTRYTLSVAVNESEFRPVVAPLPKTVVCKLNEAQQLSCRFLLIDEVTHNVSSILREFQTADLPCSALVDFSGGERLNVFLEMQKVGSRARGRVVSFKDSLYRLPTTCGHGGVVRTDDGILACLHEGLWAPQSTLPEIPKVPRVGSVDTTPRKKPLSQHAIDLKLALDTILEDGASEPGSPESSSFSPISTSPSRGGSRKRLGSRKERKQRELRSPSFSKLSPMSKHGSVLDRMSSDFDFEALSHGSPPELDKLNTSMSHIPRVNTHSPPRRQLTQAPAPKPHASPLPRSQTMPTIHREASAFPVASSLSEGSLKPYIVDVPELEGTVESHMGETGGRPENDSFSSSGLLGHGLRKVLSVAESETVSMTASRGIPRYPPTAAETGGDPESEEGVQDMELVCHTHSFSTTAAPLVGYPECLYNPEPEHVIVPSWHPEVLYLEEDAPTDVDDAATNVTEAAGNGYASAAARVATTAVAATAADDVRAADVRSDDARERGPFGRDWFSHGSMQSLNISDLSSDWDCVDFRDLCIIVRYLQLTDGGAPNEPLYVRVRLDRRGTQSTQAQGSGHWGEGFLYPLRLSGPTDSTKTIRLTLELCNVRSECRGRAVVDLNPFELPNSDVAVPLCPPDCSNMDGNTPHGAGDHASAPQESIVVSLALLQPSGSLQGSPVEQSPATHTLPGPAEAESSSNTNIEPDVSIYTMHRFEPSKRRMGREGAVRVRDALCGPDESIQCTPGDASAGSIAQRPVSTLSRASNRLHPSSSSAVICVASGDEEEFAEESAKPGEHIEGIPRTASITSMRGGTDVATWTSRVTRPVIPVADAAVEAVPEVVSLRGATSTLLLPTTILEDRAVGAVVAMRDATQDTSEERELFCELRGRGATLSMPLDPCCREHDGGGFKDSHQRVPRARGGGDPAREQGTSMSPLEVFERETVATGDGLYNDSSVAMNLLSRSTLGGTHRSQQQDHTSLNVQELITANEALQGEVEELTHVAEELQIQLRNEEIDAEASQQEKADLRRELDAQADKLRKAGVALDQAHDEIKHLLDDRERTSRDFDRFVARLREAEADLEKMAEYDTPLINAAHVYQRTAAGDACVLADAADASQLSMATPRSSFRGGVGGARGSPLSSPRSPAARLGTSLADDAWRVRNGPPMSAEVARQADQALARERFVDAVLQEPDLREACRKRFGAAAAAGGALVPTSASLSLALAAPSPDDDPPTAAMKEYLEAKSQTVDAKRMQEAEAVGNTQRRKQQAIDSTAGASASSPRGARPPARGRSASQDGGAGGRKAAAGRQASRSGSRGRRSNASDTFGSPRAPAARAKGHWELSPRDSDAPRRRLRSRENSMDASPPLTRDHAHPSSSTILTATASPLVLTPANVAAHAQQCEKVEAAAFNRVVDTLLDDPALAARVVDNILEGPTSQRVLHRLAEDPQLVLRLRDACMAMPGGAPSDVEVASWWAAVEDHPTLLKKCEEEVRKMRPPAPVGVSREQQQHNSNDSSFPTTSDAAGGRDPRSVDRDAAYVDTGDVVYPQVHPPSSHHAPTSVSVTHPSGRGSDNGKGFSAEPGSSSVMDAHGQSVGPKADKQYPAMAPSSWTSQGHGDGGRSSNDGAARTHPRPSQQQPQHPQEPPYQVQHPVHSEPGYGVQPQPRQQPTHASSATPFERPRPQASLGGYSGDGSIGGPICAAQPQPRRSLHSIPASSLPQDIHSTGHVPSTQMFGHRSGSAERATLPSSPLESRSPGGGGQGQPQPLAYQSVERSPAHLQCASAGAASQQHGVHDTPGNSQSQPAHSPHGHHQPQERHEPARAGAEDRRGPPTLRTSSGVAAGGGGSSWPQMHTLGGRPQAQAPPRTADALGVSGGDADVDDAAGVTARATPSPVPAMGSDDDIIAARVGQIRKALHEEGERMSRERSRGGSASVVRAGSAGGPPSLPSANSPRDYSPRDAARGYGGASPRREVIEPRTPFDAVLEQRGLHTPSPEAHPAAAAAPSPSVLPVGTAHTAQAAERSVGTPAAATPAAARTATNSGAWGTEASPSAVQPQQQQDAAGGGAPAQPPPTPAHAHAHALAQTPAGTPQVEVQVPPMPPNRTGSSNPLERVAAAATPMPAARGVHRRELSPPVPALGGPGPAGNGNGVHAPPAPAHVGARGQGAAQQQPQSLPQVQRAAGPHGGAVSPLQHVTAIAAIFDDSNATFSADGFAKHAADDLRVPPRTITVVPMQLAGAEQEPGTEATAMVYITAENGSAAEALARDLAARMADGRHPLNRQHRVLAVDMVEGADDADPTVAAAAQAASNTAGAADHDARPRIPSPLGSGGGMRGRTMSPAPVAGETRRAAESPTTAGGRGQRGDAGGDEREGGARVTSGSPPPHPLRSRSRSPRPGTSPSARSGRREPGGPQKVDPSFQWLLSTRPQLVDGLIDSYRALRVATGSGGDGERGGGSVDDSSRRGVELLEMVLCKYLSETEKLHLGIGSNPYPEAQMTEAQFSRLMRHSAAGSPTRLRPHSPPRQQPRHTTYRSVSPVQSSMSPSLNFSVSPAESDAEDHRHSGRML